jgi:hypothetical protein
LTKGSTRARPAPGQGSTRCRANRQPGNHGWTGRRLACSGWGRKRSTASWKLGDGGWRGGPGSAEPGICRSGLCIVPG